jgi:macrolide-specific efflux system membrane fusion protein
VTTIGTWAATVTGRWAWIGSLSCVLAVSGCTGQGPVSAPARPSADGVGLVRPEKRDVSSVVVTDGQVTAFPTYVVPAPAAGVVRLSVRPGARVTVNQPLGRVGGAGLRAPADGTIVSVVATGNVPANAPVLVVRHQGFAVTAMVTAQNMYRVYGGIVAGRASLTSGPSGVTCTVVPVAPQGSGTPSGAQPPGAGPGGDDVLEAGLPTVCLLPQRVRAFDGLPAKVGLQFATVHGALTLPVAAVAGSSQQGEVTVVNRDGAHETRQVRLGVSDGSLIQILAGLEPGEQVLAQAPDFTG